MLLYVHRNRRDYYNIRDGEPTTATQLMSSDEAGKTHLVLTLSLLCHFKTTTKTSKSAKFEIVRLFFFFLSFLFVLALACKWIFIKTHSIQIRFATGPKKILFAGACVHFSARKFYGLGGGGGGGAVKGLICPHGVATLR